MTEDIVARLRADNDFAAVFEIERLRAEVEHLRAIMRECSEAGLDLARRATGTNPAVRQRAIKAFQDARDMLPLSPRTIK